MQVWESQFRVGSQCACRRTWDRHSFLRTCTSLPNTCCRTSPPTRTFCLQTHTQLQILSKTHVLCVVVSERLIDQKRTNTNEICLGCTWWAAFGIVVQYTGHFTVVRHFAVVTTLISGEFVAWILLSNFIPHVALLCKHQLSHSAPKYLRIEWRFFGPFCDVSAFVLAVFLWWPRAKVVFFSLLSGPDWRVQGPHCSRTVTMALKFRNKMDHTHVVRVLTVLGTRLVPSEFTIGAAVILHRAAETLPVQLEFLPDFDALQLVSHVANHYFCTKRTVLLRGKLYAVRATERVPAGSCHFPCFTDPSQSVVSFPCVRKWECIKTMYATSAWALAHWLWSRCYSTREQKASVVCPVRKECKVAGPWTSGASPIVPFMFSGWPQGLRASME